MMPDSTALAMLLSGEAQKDLGTFQQYFDEEMRKERMMEEKHAEDVRTGKKKPKKPSNKGLKSQIEKEFGKQDENAYDTSQGFYPSPVPIGQYSFTYPTPMGQVATPTPFDLPQFVPMAAPQGNPLAGLGQRHQLSLDMILQLLMQGNQGGMAG